MICSDHLVVKEKYVILPMITSLRAPYACSKVTSCRRLSIVFLQLACITGSMRVCFSRLLVRISVCQVRHLSVVRPLFFFFTFFRRSVCSYRKSLALSSYRFISVVLIVVVLFNATVGQSDCSLVSPFN